MQRKKNIFAIFFFVSFLFYAQNNKISIEAKLLEGDKILINQEIVYHNVSDDALDTIYLLNWANAYKDRNTPLSKRMIDDYDRRFYFARLKERGYSKIHLLQNNGQNIRHEEPVGAEDLVKVMVPETLLPGDSVKLHIIYEVKLPSDRFTRYGQDGTNYNLRYWHLTPAIYDQKWQLFSNLNMDDYYVQPTDYQIDFRIPMGYSLHSDLNAEVTMEENTVLYKLQGQNRLDVELNIQLNNDFSVYQTKGTEIITNLKSKNLTENIKGDVLQRQLDFINQYLGKYPHEKMLVNKTTYLKQPVYGFNQLPKSMNPFSDIFEWDIKLFKAITDRYIENTILTNKREDNWLADGIQIYLMIAYVNAYYPEVKAIGNISKKWGIRRYNISKLEFNGKYPFVYQFSTRKQLDQALSTRSDSLSNLNLKLVNRYKSGLGLRYLDAYLKEDIIKNSLKEFYSSTSLTLTKTDAFNEILKGKTDKNLDWYFNDYLLTRKKINYTIKTIEKQGDSVKVLIKNKSNFKAPITLYGVDKKTIKFKQWLEPIEDEQSFTVSQKNIDRLSLNYEYLLPEANLRDNWKRLDKKLFNRPLKFTFFRDIEDPYYNQVFYKPFIGYNLYDGLLLGPTFYNQALFKKKWLFTASPVYGFKSQTLTGAVALAYEHLPEETSVYRYRAGLSAARSHYDEDLGVTKFTPFVSVSFKRKSLRDVGGKNLFARYVFVDKDLPDPMTNPESYKYDIFNVRYSYSKPDIINNFRYFADFQYKNDFSKVSLDIRYRKLMNIKRHIDFRLFFGSFLYNDTETDFFSYAIDRPTDYLFDLNYLGRSESSGFLSQQVILAEGGFKSIFEDQYANEWILTSNFGIGIWRWVELYADVGYLKNKGESARFKYDSGVRLNFIPDLLELYFPVQSSLGFEPGFSDYASRIRFVITLNFESYYNFIKRGFY